MARKRKKKLTYRAAFALVLIAGVAIYALLPRLDSFETSLHVMSQAKFGYLLIAVGFFVATYFASTTAYLFITYFKLRFWRTFLVQIADGFTSRVTPAGVGAVATNILYLTRQSKSAVKASYVAILNGLVGFMAHIVLLCLLFILKPSTEDIISFKTPNIKLIAPIIIAIIIIGLVVFWRRLRPRSSKILADLSQALKASIKKPWRLLVGLFAAMGVTLLYTLTLYMVTKSLGVDLSLLQTFLVLTVGVMATVITPTPGGIVGVEAGFIATLIAFGVESGAALSITLLYRLITFWLPIIPGIVALELAIKKGYLTRQSKPGI